MSLRRQQARSYRRQGFTYKRIAELMGISEAWAYLLCVDEQYAKNKARSIARQASGVCPDCGGPMTRPEHGGYTIGKPYGRCQSCRIKKVRAESHARAVNGETARCGMCKAYKPFDAFAARPLRRVLNGETYRLHCRECDTAARRAYREQRKVPCDNCGKPRLPAIEKIGRKRRGTVKDTGLCLACYRASLRKAA